MSSPTSSVHGPLHTQRLVFLAKYSFPPSTSHSIQALDQGLEILLIFTGGDFDASGTRFGMLSAWLAHTPIEIVPHHLGANMSVLANIPQKDPRPLGSTVVPPPFGDTKDQAVADSIGEVRSPFEFHLIHAVGCIGGAVIVRAGCFPSSVALQ